MKKVILFLIIICLLVFVFAGYKITNELRAQKEEINDFNELDELVAESTNTQEQTEPTIEQENNDPSIETETTPIIPARNLAPLFEKNADCIGWVYIEGTAVDYPVMHTPDEPQKYLRKNFDKEYSSAGVPFLNGICTLDCDHLILYGHNMKNGTMFSDVTQYRSKNYYLEHPFIEFETVHGLKRYAIFAVVQVKNNEGWYAFHTSTDESEYNTRIAEIKERSLYDTKITPIYGQQLITLSTCYGATKSDRIIVVGVEMHDYRPVIILQNNVGNKHSTTVIVAPLTRVMHGKAKLPTHYTMKAQNGLEKPSIVLLEQIHTLDKKRLTKYIGRATDTQLAGIEFALAISLGLIDPVGKAIEIGLCSTCEDMLSNAGAFSIESKNTACTCSRCGFPKGTVYKVKQKGGS